LYMHCALTSNTATERSHSDVVTSAECDALFCFKKTKSTQSLSQCAYVENA